MTTATIVEERRTIPYDVDRERFVRVSWGALFAGAFVAAASWILLYAFGLAVGLSAIDPDDLGSARVAGIGTGIWSIIAPLIALFAGGYVASHFAGRVLRRDGILHGVVVWALTAVAGLLVLGLVLSNIMGAIFGVGTQAMQAAAMTQQSQPAGAGGGGLQALGLNYDDMVAPINQRLEAQGLPTITAAQLQASMQDSVQTMVRSGRFDREALIASLANNTQMSRSEAEQVAATVEGRFSAAAQNVQEGALVAADRTGKAFWGIALALLLGLVSAILGAAVGAGPRRPRDRDRDVIVGRTAPAVG
jgi:hypothetical protein